MVRVSRTMHLMQNHPRPVYRPMAALMRRKRLPRRAALVPRLLMIWRQRPDLQASFDLDRTAGREGLFIWYLFHAYRELGLRGDADSLAMAPLLNTPIARLPQHTYLPVTWLMWEMRKRSDIAFPPRKTPEGQAQLLAWYFTKGLTDFYLDEFLTQQQADALLSKREETGNASRLHHLIWENDPQLRAAYGSAEDPAFLLWCRTSGARDYPILAHKWIDIGIPPRNRVMPRPWGVNLIGHALSRSGLSEDIRMAALSLTSADIPFSIYNVAPGAHMEEDDSQLRDAYSKELPYSVNLFCMTGMTTVTSVINDRALGDGSRRYIGMWPWELEEWPPFWSHAYQTVDEIWATSHYSYAAYARSSPIPVRHVPMAVSVSDGEGKTRTDFGLPNDRFLFLHAFDGLSSFARKNPLGCIQAFQHAFPNADAKVGLVLKGLRVANDAAWAEIERIAAADQRIYLITASLSRPSLLDLYRAADAFISLHRSEGFGRNIAEMMMLKKPVIVSAHSGNMDFTNFDNAALVPVGLRSLKDGDYPFGRGQRWAEPDLRRAAQSMVRMVEDADWRETLGRTAHSHITAHYSPHIVGAAWKALLAETP
ncbi:glycosyltransferase [Sphingobium sp. 3R8]|uniref:glycosyltransferase n=1 Tax=Sphingobium sp. 3R8 TaxID=2874921 RepID=UPI001CCA9257|nr:glycosyltransferase [Sphingobium sp. 3R8]MBZ9647040.1 glycosyltransferase [Sphingobium sp. 3R8]